MKGLGPTGLLPHAPGQKKQAFLEETARTKRPEPARITVFTSDFASPESFSAVFTGSSVLWKRSSWAGENLTGEGPNLLLPCFTWCLSVTQTISKCKLQSFKENMDALMHNNPSTVYKVEGRRAWTFWIILMHVLLHVLIQIHNPRVVELLELCSSQCFGEIFSVGKSCRDAAPSKHHYLIGWYWNHHCSPQDAQDIYTYTYIYIYMYVYMYICIVYIVYQLYLCM